MRALIPALTVLGLLLTASLPALAQYNKEDVDFKITVRAHDGQFIGTSMGGAHVVIRDRRNGDILIDGITYGGTGDRKTIMEDGHKRDAVLVGDDTANMQFSLALFEPTPVTISVTAPVAQAQSAVTVSADYTLIPGKDYTTGNGILIDVPGFVVDVTNPPIASHMKLDADKAIPVEADIAKLCGCKIDDQTPWPPERYEVDAHIYKDTTFITSVKMNHGDQPGKYMANLKMPVAGTYRIIVSAFDPQTKEGGTDSTTITIEQ